MRAFVEIRQVLANNPFEGIRDIRQEMIELKAYMDEVLTDQNDINEDTRVQLELINQTLAEMQMKNKDNNSQRRKIGF